MWQTVAEIAVHNWMFVGKPVCKSSVCNHLNVNHLNVNHLNANHLYAIVCMQNAVDTKVVDANHLKSFERRPDSGYQSAPQLCE